MTAYRPTDADRQPLPEQYRTERRHLGDDADERTRPFARYFSETGTLPVQPHIQAALDAPSPPSAARGYEIDEVASRLRAKGYEDGETALTWNERGTLTVSCLTHMPGVTADMWDWWFGWHSADSARYKLWHPDAHEFAAIGQDRSADRTLSDRQRYVNNVSYVDEFIGDSKRQLAIRFVDPKILGFDECSGETQICARVGLSGCRLPLGGSSTRCDPPTTAARCGHGSSWVTSKSSPCRARPPPSPR